MRNHLDKRVLRRAWTTRPSDRESAFPDGVELVSHLTDCKGLQMRAEQLGPLRGKHVLGQTPAARAAALGHADAAETSQKCESATSNVSGLSALPLVV